MDTMSHVLCERLLASSAQTLLLAALVWALARAWPRIPAATQCWLWWLVAVQALLGLACAPLQLPWLPAPAVPAGAAIVLDLPPAAQAAAQGQALAAMPAGSAPVAWPVLALAAWLAGVLLLAVRTALGWRASRQLVAGSQPCGDRALEQALALAVQAHGLQHAPRLRVSAQVESPQLVGLWRPVLLLPARAPLDGDELDMALTHELAHLQRADLWLGLVPALARHLFWFHPLVHLAAREYGLAREAACDAAVVAHDGQRCHAYGRLLLRLGVGARPVAGVASASPTFRILKRRLTMLQHSSPLPRLASWALVIAVAATGVAPLRLVAADPAVADTQTTRREHTRVVVDGNVVQDRTTTTVNGQAVPAAAPESAAQPAARAAAAPRAGAVVVPDPPAPPAVPDAPPPPPAPPAPPASAHAPVTTTGVLYLTTSAAPAQAYVRVRGAREAVMSGSTEDLEAALASGRDLLWLRRGQDRYVIRDGATLARFDALFEPIARIGRQQGELGQRQGELGRQQGELGQQMGRLAMAQARTAMTRAGRDDDTDDEAGQASTGQHEVEQRMRALSEQQAALGRQQSALGQQQAQASSRANKALQALMDQAIASGRAQRIGQG